MAAKDDEIAQMAREKITAIYGKAGLKKDYGELVGAREVPVIPGTGTKTLNFDTAKELSESIGCYIRSDKKSEQQFWPLVKRVTISLPKSPALLEGIVLVDLPGAGDVSKCRSDMWKECLSQCSSVWIVNEMKRALSEKVADEIFDTSLRTIAGGGECHNITFICTQTDDIDPENFRENYHITDEDLDIESNIDKDAPEYEKKEKHACILSRNEIFKEEISTLFKDKIKKFLLGDEDHSNEFFDVYTVSSKEFKRIAQGKSTVLDRNETELPALMEHIKKLYVSHFEKKVKDYVSEVSGIISYLHFSKDALSSKYNKRLQHKQIILNCLSSTGPSRTSIKGQFESFQENFITTDLLKYNKTKNEEKYLRLVYIRTEQRKVHRKLEKEILQRKKLIYNSLSDSIRDTMKQTYQECSDITGKESFRKIQEKLKSAIEVFKKTMFHNAMRKMLEEFSDLQKYLVDQITTQMTTALMLGLNQIPEDLTGLPDVSEETEMMERCCESLDLQVF
ncbi:nuclear GTPase SLIP-GC-like [Conger conger]|uniref:nuclear GTPase SLIP-GC-like n=1 Tax=Conger conger TaxID=82655 RepID=UPI002A599E9D|nr:nuclear GTPase SLIP-GC-like [Conger conger]